MINEAQDSKYWRAWGAVVRANEWRMQSGALHPRARLEDSDEHKKVRAFAELIARQDNRAIQPNDLRHGIHWLALGRDKAHKKFDNRDLDRVLTAFSLLTDPNNLAAVGNYLAYQRGEDPGGHKRLIVGIKSKAPEAYIQAISLGKFGTKDWESLNGQQLFRLNMTLSNRHAAWKKPVKDRTPVPAGENYPF